jgi:hypothetical protein
MSQVHPAVARRSFHAGKVHADYKCTPNAKLPGAPSKVSFLGISINKGCYFGLYGEIWRFAQPFLHRNAVGTLSAASYAARKNLVFDADFGKGSTGASRH